MSEPMSNQEAFSAGAYIEYQGIKYAWFDELNKEHKSEHHSEQWFEPVPIPERDGRIRSRTTLINVRWRSDEGTCAPHDVVIEGEYTMHIPQEDADHEQVNSKTIARTITAEQMTAVTTAVQEAMIEHGPDGHIDGYEEISAAALKAAGLMVEGDTA